MAGAVGFHVEAGIGAAHQLDFLRQLGIGDAVILDHLADARAIR